MKLKGAAKAKFLAKMAAGRKKAGKRAAVKHNPPSGAVDETAATKLKLCIDNDGVLYQRQTQAVYANLAKKREKGTYQHAAAAKLFGYLVDAGAKKYAKEFATLSEWNRIFSVATRKAVAEAMAMDFEAKAALGHFGPAINPRRKGSVSVTAHARRTPPASKRASFPVDVKGHSRRMPDDPSTVASRGKYKRKPAKARAQYGGWATAEQARAHRHPKEWPMPRRRNPGGLPIISYLVVSDEAKPLLARAARKHGARFATYHHRAILETDTAQDARNIYLDAGVLPSVYHIDSDDFSSARRAWLYGRAERVPKKKRGAKANPEPGVLQSVLVPIAKAHTARSAALKAQEHTRDLDARKNIDVEKGATVWRVRVRPASKFRTFRTATLPDGVKLVYGVGAK